MKLPIRSYHKKLILIIGSLGFQFVGLTVAHAGTKDPLSIGYVRPGHDYRAASFRGYLIVYSATDRFEDGGVPYYPHSSYSIYASDGKFVKRVENHVSFSDETPQTVTLPVGSYTVEARSESEGYLRIHIVITNGRPTVIELDDEQTNARATHSRRLANR